MSLIDSKPYKLEKGKYIRNVNGSAEDKIPPDAVQSWIGAWQAVTGEALECCICGGPGFGHKMVGGHVVLGTGGNQGEASAESQVLKGGNRVFIAPICDICNQNSSYMQLKKSAKLMHLWEYLYDGEWGAWEDQDGDWIGANGQYIETTDGWRKEWQLELAKYANAQLNPYDSSYLSQSAPSVRSSFSTFSRPSRPGRGSGGDGLGIYGKAGFQFY